MDWNDYEKITKDIYETLGKESEVKIECYGNNCKIIGITGVPHQIDVLASHSDGIHIYKTAIECKYVEKKVNRDIVYKLKGIIKDSQIDKGVVVSKKGFTPDAITVAKSENIGLVWLREIEKEDFGKHLPISEMLNSKVISPKITKFVINSKEGDNRASELVQISKILIVNSSGEKRPIQALIDEFNTKLFKENAIIPITVNYHFEGCSIWNTETNISTPIEGFTITGLISEKEVDLGFKEVDKIWLIMKSIFEDKIITVSEKRVIKESKFRFIN